MTVENATETVECAMLKSIKAGFGLPASVLNGPSNYSSAVQDFRQFSASHTPSPSKSTPQSAQR